MSRLLLLTTLIVASGAPGVSRADVPSPTVTGPITGGIHGHPLFDSPASLQEIGYVDEEFFISGTARSLNSATTTAPYTTRIIVTRPIESARFNGTVMMDWVNVTAQFENAVDSILARQMLQREGFAYVHVSAQAAGVCCTPLTPKVWDPVRYEPLSHPGDDYSFDIFSQVARAIRAPSGVAPLGALQADRVIAAGQSQSAGRLNTYVRSVQARDRVIDGFLIHGGGSKSWASPPEVPVLMLYSDFEATAAAPTTDVNYRLWEIAGSSHSDFWLGYQQVFGQGPRTFAAAQKHPPETQAELDATAGNYGAEIHPMQATCILAGNLFPMRYATSAGIHALDTWVRTGDAPATAPRYEFSNGRLALDQHGNARGGIRLPPVEVPIATYVSTSCGLGGLTVPFSEVQILQLYPTHADYYDKIQVQTALSVAAGWLLAEDATDLLQRACTAKVRWQDVSGENCASTG